MTKYFMAWNPKVIIPRHWFSEIGHGYPLRPGFGDEGLAAHVPVLSQSHPATPIAIIFFEASIAEAWEFIGYLLHSVDFHRI
jgi:hypothetical protein